MIFDTTLLVVFFLTVSSVTFCILYFKAQRKGQVLLGQISNLQTQLIYEKQHIQDKENILLQSHQQFQTLLESMSQKALISNNQSFMNLAKSMFDELHERAKSEMDQKQSQINHLVEPLKQALEKVDLKMENLEKERVMAFVDLKRQVSDLITTQKELRFETMNLVKALRTPNGRGQWGEIQLRRVIEMAGMVNHCDFVEQATVADGKLRPDVLVRLPGKKNLVIDAKTPLLAYLEALECQDEKRKQTLLQDHARQVRSHINSLAKRNYYEQFEHSPEFVVMFIPGESIFSAALEADPTLIEHGVQEKVIMATPTTLIALLRAVSYGWQQEAVAENARQIGQLGRDFFKRLIDFSAHLARVGKHLSQAVSAYNDGIGAFERRVMVSARRFKELDPGLDTVPDLEIAALDIQPRPLESQSGTINDTIIGEKDHEI